MNPLKRISIILLCVVASATAWAATPDDEMFIEMAVTAARTNVENGREARGAVAAVGGAWKGTGMASDGMSAEQAVVDRAGKARLRGATVYTVVHPTAADLEMLADCGIVRVVYVIEPTEGKPEAPQGLIVEQIDFAPALELINE